MSAPAISIILPAYNSERFLKEAIDSLLIQTFTDFELMIINDGSTDSTEQIIAGYNDSRVNYIKNEVNSGLIFTLNKGLQLATGKYIARMDADDICHPERLQKQFDWFEQNPNVSLLCCNVAFIDEGGKITGEWKEDLETTSPGDIKKRIVWENCIAHPTVMFTGKVAQRYRYDNKQINTEDYDLWLRVIADGLTVEKVPEKLLLYRVHDASVTGSILRKTNPFFKQFNCKRRFLWSRITNGEWGIFESKVWFTALYDGVMGIGKTIKRIFTN